MTDISFALAAKSDQLNAVDIMGYEPIIRIREVKVVKGDQPVHIYFDGDNNRPWKPSKGMLRILAAAWGTQSSEWVGKYAQIFMNPTVKYAGKEVGGIQIRGLSDIDRDMNFMLALNRGNRVPYPVVKIEPVTKEYPADEFEKRLPAMIEAMASGKMTLQQVIAQCQKSGVLSAEQIKQLEQNAPVDLTDEQEEIE